MTEWACEAYGEDGREVGALCFRSAEMGVRVCPSAAACHEVMAAERQRLFRRINELAAAGDPIAADLEGEFTDPAQLLGGDPQ